MTLKKVLISISLFGCVASLVASIGSLVIILSHVLRNRHFLSSSVDFDCSYHDKMLLLANLSWAGFSLLTGIPFLILTFKYLTKDPCYAMKTPRKFMTKEMTPS